LDLCVNRPVFSQFHIDSSCQCLLMQEGEFQCFLETAQHKIPSTKKKKIQIWLLFLLGVDEHFWGYIAVPLKLEVIMFIWKILFEESKVTWNCECYRVPKYDNISLAYVQA
jgi:hypothetical protein